MMGDMRDCTHGPPQDAKKKGPSEKELLRTAMVRRHAITCVLLPASA